MSSAPIGRACRAIDRGPNQRVPEREIRTDHHEVVRFGLLGGVGSTLLIVAARSISVVLDDESAAAISRYICVSAGRVRTWRVKCSSSRCARGAAW